MSRERRDTLEAVPSANTRDESPYYGETIVWTGNCWKDANDLAVYGTEQSSPKRARLPARLKRKRQSEEPTGPCTLPLRTRRQSGARVRQSGLTTPMQTMEIDIPGAPMKKLMVELSANGKDKAAKMLFEDDVDLMRDNLRNETLEQSSRPLKAETMSPELLEPEPSSPGAVEVDALSAGVSTVEPSRAGPSTTPATSLGVGTPVAQDSEDRAEVATPEQWAAPEPAAEDNETSRDWDRVLRHQRRSETEPQETQQRKRAATASNDLSNVSVPPADLSSITRPKNFVVPVHIIPMEMDWQETTDELRATQPPTVMIDENGWHCSCELRHIELSDISIHEAKNVTGVVPAMVDSPEELDWQLQRWGVEYCQVLTDMWWAGATIGQIQRRLEDGLGYQNETEPSEIAYFLRFGGLWWADAETGVVP